MNDLDLLEVVIDFGAERNVSRVGFKRQEESIVFFRRDSGAALAIFSFQMHQCAVLAFEQLSEQL